MNGYKRIFLFSLVLPALGFFAGCGQNPVDPEGFSGSSGGCADFRVYKFNSNQTDAVVVDAKAADLILDRTTHEYPLPNASFDVRIERFSGPALMRYCNDVIDGNLKLVRTWKAVSGTVQVTSGDSVVIPQVAFTPYKVWVVLRNVTFRDNYGEEVFIKELDFGEITVGWLPG